MASEINGKLPDQRIRVLIVDDESYVRKYVGTILESIPTVKVCAEAGDGEQALVAYRATQPDLVLLDVNMPKLTGIETLRKIRQLDSNATVIMVTSLQTMDVVKEAVEAGASNYILKDNPPEKIREIVGKISSKLAREKLKGSKEHELQPR